MDGVEVQALQNHFFIDLPSCTNLTFIDHSFLIGAALRSLPVGTEVLDSNHENSDTNCGLRCLHTLSRMFWLADITV